MQGDELYQTLISQIYREKQKMINLQGMDTLKIGAGITLLEAQLETTPRGRLTKQIKTAQENIRKLNILKRSLR